MPFTRSSLLDRLNISQDSVWKIHVVDFTSVSLVLKMAQKVAVPLMGQMEHRPKSKRIKPDPLAKRHNRLCLNQAKNSSSWGTQPRKINRLKPSDHSTFGGEAILFDCPSLSFSSLLLMRNFLYKNRFMSIWRGLLRIFFSNSLCFSFFFFCLISFDPLQTKRPQLVNQRTRQNRTGSG